eukprot:CAMPEP_0184310444 /NCGR_PEP_ID=MMETSP1049-20130417/30330_1 /TAXON_ID=77928 /ORGANISM="Proteomonas sulcata, Strain CCMP704" /LENGTH=41 /DNA_ID= /DNA_START= /DNA_END= /DNA_ORIENTATION=
MAVPWHESRIYWGGASPKLIAGMAKRASQPQQQQGLSPVHT